MVRDLFLNSKGLWHHQSFYGGFRLRTYWKDLKLGHTCRSMFICTYERFVDCSAWTGTYDVKSDHHKGSFDMLSRFSKAWSRIHDLYNNKWKCLIHNMLCRWIRTLCTYMYLLLLYSIKPTAAKQRFQLMLLLLKAWMFYNAIHYLLKTFPSQETTPRDLNVNKISPMLAETPYL